MTGDARRTDKDGNSVVVPTLNDRDGDVFVAQVGRR
jgi:hypothetical protein